MNRKKGIEYNIRFNAALIYIIVGLACCMTIFYLYNIRGDVEERKSDIEKHRQTLVLTNKLVYAVSEVQAAGGSYISTGDIKYLNLYRAKINVAGSIIDSISLSVNDSVKQPGLYRLDSLLKKQMNIIYELGSKLAGENPLDDINKKLKDYGPVIKRDSVLITTIKQDTLVDAAPRRGFFRRLGSLFAPRKDSVIVLSNKRVDTLNITRPDTLAIIMEVDSVVRAAGEGYYKNIRDIGKRVGSLAASDQKIMEQISSLLLGMYALSLDSILAAVDESEKIIERNYIYSIIGGGVALALVFILIAVIVSGVNKARMARIALEMVNIKDKEIMESRHKLLLSVSHDLKTPLSSILGYLELQKDAGHDVRSMLSSGNYILSLWENLIEFSSIEQGKLRVSSSPFNLYDFFLTITEMFEPLAVKKGIIFESSLKLDKERFVSADYLKIKQIIVNLISNGIKYTVKGEVRFYVSCDNGFLLCKVCDTGAGIPPEYREKIFSPFQRIESNNRLAEGTGLGLYVVKEFTELLGGTLELVSEVEKGSEFTVTIPVKEIDWNDPVQHPDDLMPAGYGYAANIAGTTYKNTVTGIPYDKNGGRLTDSPLRITVIDDDALLLSVAGKMLSALGHRVTMVSDIDGIEECDIILADMEMGAFTGIDVLRRAGDTPVVIMTAGSGFCEAEAREQGFSAYLSKPFTISSLQKIFGKVRPDIKGNTEALPASGDKDMPRNDITCGGMLNVCISVAENGDAGIAEDDHFQGRNMGRYISVPGHLRELFGDDVRYMNETLEAFRISTESHIKFLRQALEEDDYVRARGICHKMYPMFAQLGYAGIAEILRRVDMNLDRKYPLWREDVSQVCSKAEEIL